MSTPTTNNARGAACRTSDQTLDAARRLRVARAIAELRRIGYEALCREAAEAARKAQETQEGAVTEASTAGGEGQRSPADQQQRDVDKVD